MMNRNKPKQTLWDYVVSHQHCSRSQAKRIIDSRMVWVNNQRVWMPKHALRPQDKVRIFDIQKEEKKAQHEPIHIAFEDEHFVIMNKPPLINTNGPRSLEQRLKREIEATYLAVHRLDRDTTGCLIIAKNQSVFNAFKALFTAKKIHKTYWAICYGKGYNGTVQKKIEGKYAHSEFKTLKKGNETCWFEITPQTGRKHQIRLHAKTIKHHLLGDKTYTPPFPIPPKDQALPHHLLHARALSFKHPFTQETINITAEPPPTFNMHLVKLKDQ